MNQDTIAAVATPPGRGGIAVVRVCGPEATAIVDKIWKGKRLAECQSHTCHLGNIIDPHTGEILDQAVATVFRGPHSYTGDDTVELSVHGSVFVQSQLLRLLIDAGCRLAEAGEYTRRAFTAGHLDLAEAEAVADLISATSRSSHRIALNQMRGRLSETLSGLRDQLLRLASLIELELDFSEEDVTFASRTELMKISDEIITVLRRLTDSFSTAKAIRDGIPLAIVGAPNVGKSTLLNTLAEDERAIVSPIAGTTRDTIEDTVEINGTMFRIVDTAGLRSDPADEIEAIGISRSEAAIKKASVVVWVVDPTQPDSLKESASVVMSALQPDTVLIVAVNKSDLKPEFETPGVEIADKATDIIKITATTRSGIEPLIACLANRIDPSIFDQALLTNSRHYQAATNALQSMEAVRTALSASQTGIDIATVPLDLVALDLRAALHHLGEITGIITTPEILASIFTRFCIGK